MKKYIAFDTETGGLLPECSLLSAYFVVLDEDLKTIMGELDMRIKPDGGKPYNVTGEALGINNINLVEHDKVAISETLASKRFFEFLQTHNPDGRDKLIPIGQNVVFDEMFLKDRLISTANWNRFISYRRVDTGTIAEFLRLTGHIPTDVKGSLTSIASFLGVNFPDAHEAKGDTLATVKCLRKMKRLVIEGR